MTKKSWVLTDTEENIWIKEMSLDAQELGCPDFPGAAIRKERLSGGLRDGVDLVEINNGALHFAVVPTRGMNIWRGSFHGDFLGWRSPVKGPVHPSFVNLSERGGLGWLSGFDEMVARCGLASNGAPTTDVMPNNMGEPVSTELTLHGRISNLPASYVEVQVIPGDPPVLRILGTVDEATLFFPQFRLQTVISTALGSNAFTITDTVTNLKNTVAEMELLYHCNFGRPYLEADAALAIPAQERAPRDAHAADDMDRWDRYIGPTPGYVEQCYWHIPMGDAQGDTLAVLKNGGGDKAVAVRFNLNQLPCFTQWKNTAGESDGYVTGLEPGTNYPNPRSFERKCNRTINLAPGDTYQASLTIEAHNSPADITALMDEIDTLQGDSGATLHWQPQAQYSCLE